MSAELIKERSGAVHVEGTGPTAFAIGCAELGLDPGKNVVRLRKNKTLRAAATEVVGTHDYVQPVLGEGADLIEFDG